MLDKEGIYKVCIDDFALTKRKKYATVMVDIETHRVIDMIESRTYEDVSAWLKTYPNLSVVTRDGSVTYRNAITAAHPTAIQVNDRLHILKNLVDYCLRYLKKQLKPRIVLKCETTSEPIVYVKRKIPH